MKIDVRVRSVGCERLGDGLGGAAALVAVGRVELRHRRLERDGLGLAEVDARSPPSTSSYSRDHAETPQTAFSVRIFSSGSVSR